MIYFNIDSLKFKILLYYTIFDEVLKIVSDYVSWVEFFRKKKVYIEPMTFSWKLC